MHSAPLRGAAEQNAARRLRSEAAALLRFILGFLALLVVWSALAYSGAIRPFFLPPPHRVGLAFWVLVRDGTLLSDTLVSLGRITAGFLLSVVVGVPLGFLVGIFKRAEELVGPPNEFLRYLPVAAFIPVCILWFGIGTGEKVAIVFLGTVFQLILLVAGECRRVPRDLVETAQTLGASGLARILRVVLPWSLPGISEHMRVSLGWAWSYLLVAEIVAANGGLGYRIIQAQRFLQTDQVIACMLAVGLLGIGMDLCWRACSRRVFRWWWVEAERPI